MLRQGCVWDWFQYAIQYRRIRRRAGLSQPRMYYMYRQNEVPSVSIHVNTHLVYGVSHIPCTFVPTTHYFGHVRAWASEQQPLRRTMNPFFCGFQIDLTRKKWWFLHRRRPATYCKQMIINRGDTFTNNIIGVRVLCHARQRVVRCGRTRHDPKSTPLRPWWALRLLYSSYPGIIYKTMGNTKQIKKVFVGRCATPGPLTPFRTAVVPFLGTNQSNFKYVVPKNGTTAVLKGPLKGWYYCM